MTLRDTALNLLTGGQYGKLTDLERRLPTMLRESTNWAVQRALEDAQWQKLGTDQKQQSGPIDRSEAIPWARAAFASDPFVKRGVWALTEFAFGNGIDGPRGSEPDGKDIQPLLDFWNDPGNRAAMFSVRRQYERSNQLLVDGDLFLTLFTKRPGLPVAVRRMGTLSIKDILQDPEDAGRPLYYVAEYRPQRFDETNGRMVETGERQLRYYRDFQNTDPATDPLADTIDAALNTYILHLPINRIGEAGFGTSECIAALPWLRAAKEIAEDQATISRATATLMNRLYVEGDETALDAFRDSLRSTSESSSPAPGTPGQYNILSEGTNLQVNRASTNALDAWQNNRMMRVPAAAAMGLALHYMADPENANLATTKSMELPILRHLEAYQSLWLDTYRDLFRFVLEQDGQDPEQVQYSIPAARMVEPDVAGQGDVILASYEAGLLTKTQAAQRIYELLGVDDIPAALLELDEEAEEQDPQIADLQAAMARLEQQQGQGNG